MSGRLISRSPDLSRLKAEGYELELGDGCLFVHGVPHVTPTQEVARGTLVCALNLAGDVTAAPSDHTTGFIGEAPCDADGSRLDRIVIGEAHQLGAGVQANFQFSSKPPSGYPDFYEKVTAYAEILSKYARTIDPEATARTHGPIRDADDGSAFEYMDTATSRAGIGAAAEKLHVGKVAIVGLGGTGSYLLDLLAKCPIGEIHLFDGDEFLSHNAFRAPGAPSIDELRAKPMKVDRFDAIYSNMKRGIVAHPYRVEESTVGELHEMDFVFICIDDGPSRQLIVEKLCEWGASFIDVGMGADESGGMIGATIRVTASTPEKRDHLGGRLPYGDPPENDYQRNIQIAELNALNAALAVIKWKKMFGFYEDIEHGHNTLYLINGNALINEDQG